MVAWILGEAATATLAAPRISARACAALRISARPRDLCGPASSAPSRTPTAEPHACSLLRGPAETDGSEQSTAACAPASVRLLCYLRPLC